MLTTHNKLFKIICKEISGFTPLSKHLGIFLKYYISHIKILTLLTRSDNIKLRTIINQKE